MIKAKKKLNFFDRLVLILNWIFAFSILISYLAPYTSPQFFWPVALFGLAYTPLLIGNALFVLYWLLRVKRQIVISVVCILLGYKVIPYTVGFNKETPDAPKASTQHIRLMEYNVHSFSDFKTLYDVKTKNAIMDVIREQQPDIINIEEFFTRYKGSFDTVDSLKKILNTNYYYFPPFEKQSAYSSGLAIFSKYPIIDTGVIRLSNDGSDTNAIFADIKNGDKIFRVYCLHLQSFLFDPVDYKYINHVTSDAHKDLFASKRIIMKLKSGFISRSKQIAIIKDHASRCPYPYIFAGDFNDTPSSYVVHQMGMGLKNAFYEKGRGIGKTYNGDFPNFQIDHIMVSPQFDVTNYKVIEKKLSDHYPIRSDLLLK